MSRILQALRRKPIAVVGHRGCAGEEVENTLAALRCAASAGVDAAEVDVQVTRDGVPVLSHDPTLARVAGVNLNVREATLEEVRRVRLPNGEPPPTLEEALELALNLKLPLLIEVKVAGDEARVVEVLGRLDAWEWVALISFHSEALESARRLAPRLPLGLIYAKPPGRILEARRIGCRIVLPKYTLATEKAVALAHRLGLTVVAWTVNSGRVAEEMLRRGVDAIATDYPRRMVEWRSRAG